MPALHTIQSTGSSSNRVDMVFLGDGYTAGEIATTYAAHVNGYVNYLFGGTALTDPFSRYHNFFNIHVVDVISNQSGADNPGTGTFRDTALNATYFFDGVTERLLSVDNTLANAATNAALLGAGFSAEMRYVTVNDTKYGGGGGLYAVYAGGNASAYEVALHEVGHSFAGLADEYGGFTTTYTGSEPAGLNITTNPTGAKWSEWLGYTDPILGLVSAYQGGGYYNSGIYRPTFDSKMRDLGRPFDPIAREEFIHKFYLYVNPLDTYDGNVGTQNNLTALHVDTIDPAVILVDWTINGTTFTNAGEAFDLSGHNFGFGTYTVTARAYDPTDWVRGDRSDLEQSVSWTVANDYRLVGTSSGETLNGTANGQEIQGNGGNDVVFAGAGNDTVYGGAGLDTLHGDDGADVLLGNADPFASEADTLDGGAGDDTLYGESTDTVMGGAGHDLLYQVNDNPWSINLSAASIEYMRAGFGNDDLNAATQSAGVEIYAGGGNDTVSGSPLADFLWAESGDDVISGGGGDDVIVGDSGADILSGGDGNDRIYVDASDFGFNGGTGFDAAYIAAGGGVTINMAATALEWVADFAGGNDALDGSGLAVDMTAFAGGGIDYIAGGAGNDFLWGEAGDDTITGNGGNDVLVGGIGADILTGGIGTDVIYLNSGGGGDGVLDSVVFTAGWGTDFVFDFVIGQDKLDLSAFGTNFAALSISNVSGHAYVHIGAGTDLIAVANNGGLLTATDFVF